MNYSFITELEAKGYQLYDELHTLINVAVPNNEMKPGCACESDLYDDVYVSKLKNGDNLYAIDGEESPLIVINSPNGIYIATTKEDTNGKTIYEYSYYDEEAKKIFEGNLDENTYFIDAVEYIESELEKCGLLPDICGDYYLEELEGTNGMVDVIEKLKQDKSKQKVKA